MPEVQQPPQQNEQFKTKIEQGVDRALPAEQIKNLKDEVKAETERNNALKAKIKDAIKSAFSAEKTADLAITNEEKNSIFNDVKSQLARKLGGEQEAQQIMQKFGINNAEKLMYRIGLRSVEEQRLYERFADFAKNKPGYVLGFSKQIKDVPWGKDMMTKAAEKSPESAFYYYKEFADMKDESAKIILQISAAKDPEAAFKYIDNYKDKKGAEEVLQTAVSSMEKPEVALKYITKLSGFKGAKDILISVVNAMQKPEEIFNILKDIVKINGASEILLNAVLLSKDKEIAFDKIDQYKSIPDAASVLNIALPLLPEKDRAFTDLPKYLDIPNADIVLINALMMGAKAETAFSWSNDFKKLPNAKGVLILAASFDPASAIKEYKLYSDLPDNGAHEVIKAAVFANPNITFENIGFLKNISPEILKYAVLNAVKNQPETAFLKFESYKDLPKESIAEILSKGAELDPAAAILNYEKYNDQNILKIAGQNMRPIDIFNNNVWNTLKANLEDGEFKTKLFKELNKRYSECRAIGDDIMKYEYNLKDSWNETIRDNYTEKFFKDPSLQFILKVKTDWIKPVPKDTTINDARIIITRNLYFQKTEPSEESVKKEWKIVLEHKEKYKNLTIFKDRNVIILAENEQYEDEKKQLFYAKGSPKLIQSIKDQGAKNLDFLRADVKMNEFGPRFQTAEKLKTQVINKIINTPPPLSFYYEGHSGPNLLLIDKSLLSEMRDAIKKLEENKFMSTKEKEILLKSKNALNKLVINDKEFAEILRQRNNKYPDEYKKMETRPIIVITSCHGSEFMRNVYSNLTTSHPLPIGIATAEYQAVSYGEADLKILKNGNLLRSEFTKTVLELDKSSKDKPTTIGTVFKNENSTKQNNPVILIPSKKRGGMQMAALEEKKGRGEEPREFRGRGREEEGEIPA